MRHGIILFIEFDDCLWIIEKKIKNLHYDIYSHEYFFRVKISLTAVVSLYYKEGDLMFEIEIIFYQRFNIAHTHTHNTLNKYTHSTHLHTPHIHTYTHT